MADLIFSTKPERNSQPTKLHTLFWLLLDYLESSINSYSKVVKILPQHYSQIIRKQGIHSSGF